MIEKAKDKYSFILDDFETVKGETGAWTCTVHSPVRQGWNYLPGSFSPIFSAYLSLSLSLLLFLLQISLSPHVLLHLTRALQRPLSPSKCPPITILPPAPSPSRLLLNLPLRITTFVLHGAIPPITGGTPSISP